MFLRVFLILGLFSLSILYRLDYQEVLFKTYTNGKCPIDIDSLASVKMCGKNGA